MNDRTTLIVTAVLLSVAIATVGSAYAYGSSVFLDGNSISATYTSIDIYKNTDGDPLDDLTFSAPQINGGTVSPKSATISGYVRIEGGGSIDLNAWVFLQDPAAWIIITDMDLSINNGHYSLGISGTSTGLPSSSITLNANTYYAFTLTITYQDVPSGLSGYGSLSDSLLQLTFAAYGTTPVPNWPPS